MELEWYNSYLGSVILTDKKIFLKNLYRDKGKKRICEKEKYLLFLKVYKFYRKLYGFSSIYSLNRFICIKAVTENEELFH